MHANVRNNEIIDFNSMYLDKDIIRVETTQDMYNLYKQNSETVVYQDGEIVLNPNYKQIELARAKEEKIEENDRKRDEKLQEGVVYNNVVFDSDTDQKVNLLAMYSTMQEDTIVWYGKNNDALLCEKEDLAKIGAMITQLHKYCWENNAYIKEQIENAKSLEELDEVVIDYSQG